MTFPIPGLPPRADNILIGLRSIKGLQDNSSYGGIIQAVPASYLAPAIGSSLRYSVQIPVYFTYPDVGLSIVLVIQSGATSFRSMLLSGPESAPFVYSPALSILLPLTGSSTNQASQVPVFAGGSTGYNPLLTFRNMLASPGCANCPANTYADITTGTLQCRPLAACTLPKVEFVTPTLFLNRVCGLLPPCNAPTEYEAIATTGFTSFRECKNVTTCLPFPAQYSRTNPDYVSHPDSDRSCDNVTICKPLLCYVTETLISGLVQTTLKEVYGTNATNLTNCSVIEYELAQPTPTSDRICLAPTVCGSDGIEAGPTMTTDRRCIVIPAASQATAIIGSSMAGLVVLIALAIALFALVQRRRLVQHAIRHKELKSLVGLNRAYCSAPASLDTISRGGAVCPAYFSEPAEPKLFLGVKNGHYFSEPAEVTFNREIIPADWQTFNQYITASSVARFNEYYLPRLEYKQKSSALLSIPKALQVKNELEVEAARAAEVQRLKEMERSLAVNEQAEREKLRGVMCKCVAACGPVCFKAYFRAPDFDLPGEEYGNEYQDDKEHRKPLWCLCMMKSGAIEPCLGPCWSGALYVFPPPYDSSGPDTPVMVRRALLEAKHHPVFHYVFPPVYNEHEVDDVHLGHFSYEGHAHDHPKGELHHNDAHEFQAPEYDFATSRLSTVSLDLYSLATQDNQYTYSSPKLSVIVDDDDDLQTVVPAPQTDYLSTDPHKTDYIDASPHDDVYMNLAQSGKATTDYIDASPHDDVYMNLAENGKAMTDYIDASPHDGNTYNEALVGVSMYEDMSDSLLPSSQGMYEEITLNRDRAATADLSDSAILERRMQREAAWQLKKKDRQQRESLQALTKAEVDSEASADAARQEKQREEQKNETAQEIAAVEVRHIGKVNVPNLALPGFETRLHDVKELEVPSLWGEVKRPRKMYAQTLH